MTHAHEAAAIMGALVVSSFVLTTVFLVSARLLARFARVAIKEAAIGFGPRLFSVSFGDGRLEVKLVPLSAYLQFAGANPYVEDPPPAPPLLLWMDAPLLPRVLTLFVQPRVVSIALVVALLRPSRGWSTILAGMKDLPAAFSGAGPLFDRAAAVLANEGFFTLAAVTFAKCVAFQLVYLPMDLVMLAGPRRAKAAAKVRAVGLLASIVFFVAWTVAFVRWAA